MLVDDDIDDQFFFCDALKELNGGFICTTADNGAEALKKIEIPPPPDLIFLDLNMPVMNGFEFITVIQKDEKYKHIPVVIFSTSSNAHDKQKAFKLGAKHYITKPTEFAKLKSLLTETLSARF